jgi:serine/threonine-protein kinase RsbW
VARTVETTIANRVDELARVTALVDALAESERTPDEVRNDMQIALDEVLTNIVAHAYADDAPHEIRVRLRADARGLEAEVEDDGRAFDPLAAPPPDTTGTLAERRVGGLGIHFVRRLMTGVEYTRSGDRNRLVLRRQHSPEESGRGPA